MKNVSISVKDAYQINPRPTGGIDDGAARTLAILLVKVVGSPDYFQQYGDRAGQEWLKRFHNLTSGFVADAGGNVTKATNESVWIYFFSSESALDGAVNIQEKFGVYNEKRPVKDQIQVRIGLHHGDVIIERGEIFGNVANLIARVVSRLPAGEICLTQAVYDQVKAKVKHPVKPHARTERDEPPLYLLKWREMPKPQPPPEFKGVLIYLRPLWSMADAHLRTIMRHLSRSNLELPPFGQVAGKVLPDRGLILSLENPQSAVRFVRHLLQVFRGRAPARSALTIPVQICVHAANYHVSSDKPPPAIPMGVDQMIPGTVYISKAACKRIPQPDKLPLDPAYNARDNRQYYALKAQPGQGREEAPQSCAFPYGAALVQGGLGPCFYCGSSRHQTGKCPTKKISGNVNALDRMGYLSPNAIAQAFRAAILTEQGVAAGDADTDTIELATAGFYELEVVHQLRMLRLLWDAGTDRWDDLFHPRRIRGRRGEGGQAWLAFNCLENASYDRAEAILHQALQETPTDYRLHALMAFLNLEHGDDIHARYYFMQALDCAKAKPQKIFLYFCLYRLARLNGDRFGSEKYLGEVLSQYPRCSEGIYRQISHKFQSGNVTGGVDALMAFIGTDHHYFVHALIDPTLAPYQAAVQRGLSSLYDAARHEAEQLIPRVEAEQERLRQLTGSEADDLMPAVARLRELYQTESYLGFLEIRHMADSLIVQIRDKIRMERRRLLERQNQMMRECNRLIAQLGPEAVRGMGRRLRSETAAIQETLQGIHQDLIAEVPGIFADAESRAPDLRERLNNAALKVRLYQNLLQAKRFIYTFARVTLVFQSLNALVALFLVPLVFRHGVALFMPFNFTYLRFYQVGILMFGGLLGFVLAIWRGLRRLRASPVG